MGIGFMVTVAMMMGVRMPLVPVAMVVMCAASCNPCDTLAYIAHLERWKVCLDALAQFAFEGKSAHVKIGRSISESHRLAGSDRERMRLLSGRHKRLDLDALSAYSCGQSR